MTEKLILIYIVIGCFLAIKYWNDTVLKNKLTSAMMMLVFWPYYIIFWGVRL